ncbi:WRKY DNA-binding transcription factor 70 [Actinidia eriantha]|uniref:WRKY DNA-binding transcription factor 70 n=1 Tax=Actinidia eriantha TaxID=165200 RepID=UPI002589BF7B|nr:WRKY DNA-binding transcription factor 70 [Actinidia eriantha]
MGTLRPEKLCANRKRLMEELVMGRDVVVQLRDLLEKPTGPGGSWPPSAEGLVVKILGSFSASLSLLKCTCETCEVCKIPASVQVGSPSSGDRRSEDSGESSKRPAVKERRGCYKRRKTSDTWMKILPTMEDGHAWRKYGQKEILNAKFPRCYFRCTHKPDQGCLATKQVQKLQEEPLMYQITYFGHHTCTNTLKFSQHTLDCDPIKPYLLNFESNNITSDQDHHHHPSYPISVKTECNKEETESNFSGKFPAAAAAEPNMWADLLAMRSDHEDVISSTTTTSSHGLEMDFLSEYVDFETDFSW